MSTAPSTRRSVLAVRGGEVRRRPDDLATEEPLELRVCGPGQPTVAVGVTMRTPGHDFELAAGFLRSEGIVEADAIGTIRYCVDADVEQRHNVVTVDVRHAVDPTLLTRRFAATAACGVCGKATLDDLALRCPVLAPGPSIDPSVLAGMVERLRAAQSVFERTGGLHAAGLFETDGAARVVREDVGRHNAVDKVLGHQILAGTTRLDDVVLAVSGRLGFEIVQKAVVAGVPLVAAVSAPSSLAVQTAQEFGVTLVGFLRGDDFNVYSHPERLGLDAD